MPMKSTGIGEVMELDFTKVDYHGGKAHIFKSELSGEWYLRLLAPNGEIIMASEELHRRDGTAREVLRPVHTE